MKDKKIIVDGILTTYGQGGQGASVLLLHGWGDRHETFDVLADSLSNKYAVFAPDLPGFGRSQMPSRAWSLDDYAAFVGSFVRKAGVSNLAAVIGHSNGGAIAIRGLATGTFYTDKLILLAASGIRKKRKTRNVGLAAAAKFGKIAAIPLSNRLRQRLQKKLYQLAGSDALVAPELTESFKKIIRQDVRSDAVKLNLPTLLLYGSRDESTPASFGALYQQLIEGSELEIVQDAGHFIHHDAPDVVIKRVRDFIT